MSSFLVSTHDIDLLISAALEWKFYVKKPGGIETGPITRMEARAFGIMLWSENVKSLAYRYADDIASEYDYVEQYTFREYLMVKPAAIAGIANCYNYQSCEHPGYEASLAKDFINRLLAAAAKKLAGDGAPWGVHDETEAKKYGSPVSKDLFVIGGR